VAFATFEALAFPPGQDEASRDGPRTDGLVVVRGGRIVYERYARGFGPDTPHIAWSASKSILHAVYGAAVAEARVDIDRPVAEKSPWIGTGAKARITYRELLQMRSGLAFEESYEVTPLRSSVVAMLYTRGHRDMAAFAAGHELAAEPGSRWAYKSGDSLILSAALRDLVGPELYPDYPWTALFDRTGVRSAVWERDGAGTFVASSYLYATPRDLARFGLLYARDGCWSGERILPHGWADFAATLSPPLLAPEHVPWWRRWFGGNDPPPASYGAHWWLNRAGLAEWPPFPVAPEGLLWASGHWGQSVLVLPRRDLVIVRTADDREEFPVGSFLRAALAAFAPDEGR
jgi:CubicO group peptidase (beta-lactamase class C family)